MTTDSQYSWPRFFMELADKLLAFKDDRQALIATLQHVYAELGMDLPTLDSGGIPALHNWGCSWGLNPPVSRSARVM